MAANHLQASHPARSPLLDVLCELLVIQCIVCEDMRRAQLGERSDEVVKVWSKLAKLQLCVIALRINAPIANEVDGLDALLSSYLNHCLTNLHHASTCKLMLMQGIRTALLAPVYSRVSLADVRAL